MSDFRQSIRTALDNPNLAGALGRFSEAYRTSRAKAYEGVDFESVRARIAQVKSYAAGNLEKLAEMFTNNAEASGAKVFRTSSPEAVVAYILRIARANGVRSVVKHGRPGHQFQVIGLQARSQRKRLGRYDHLNRGHGFCHGQLLELREYEPPR